MKPAVELDELVERIRRAADLENGPVAGATNDDFTSSGLPPVPEPALPPSSTLSSPSTGNAVSRPESLLDQAAAWLQNGRRKNQVSGSVPKLLRPLFRNQGGFNSVLLEAVERLVEVNRNLRQQNFELQERMMDFHAWAHAVAETGLGNRGWMEAAAARLQSFKQEQSEQVEKVSPTSGQTQAAPVPVDVSGSLPELEARVAHLRDHVEVMETERRALNDHLNRLREQLSQQADYIRTVHGNLDQLGAYVETSLARVAPSA